MRDPDKKKNRFRHRCFSLIFAEILKTVFFIDYSGRCLCLWTWLLLTVCINLVLYILFFIPFFFCLKNYNLSTFCRQLDKILDLFCCGNTRSWSEKILFYVYHHVNISKMENIFSYLGDQDIPFHATSLFLYHLKISENPWKFLFLWCFQVVQKKAVTWNRIYQVN